jgi:lipopolysaccharide/colanic/teichoic acid biosynthesis glycosyltransferase
MNKILVLGVDDLIHKFKSEYSAYMGDNNFSFHIIEENISVNDIKVNFIDFRRIIYMNNSFSKNDYDFFNAFDERIQISYFFNKESINLKFKNHILWGIPHQKNRSIKKNSFLQIFLEKVAALFALIILSPLFLIASIIIYLTDGLPIFFTQNRTGMNSNEFKIYKFRTLKNSTPKYMKSSEKTINYYTKIGLFLRKSNIDELPQLINILNGTMSFIGPRPEMPFITKKYNYLENFRLNVSPGISGLWQISRAREREIHYNLEHDFVYLNKKNLIYDLFIILKTIFKF